MARNRRYEFIRTGAGFSLIELAIAMAVMSVLAIGIAELMTTFSADVRRINAWSARSEISSSIRTAARRFEAYRNSLVYEPSLGPCLSFSTDGPMCRGKGVNGIALRVPFTLASIQSSDEILAGPAVATGDLSPVYYDRAGSRCRDARPAADRCPIQAIVDYTAACINGAPECRGAETIELHYLVKYRDDYQNTPGDTMMPLEGKVLFQPRDASLRILSAATLDKNYLSDVDWTARKVLAVDPSAPVYISFSMKSELPVDTIEVRSYDLPDGCTLASDPVGACARPALNDYTLLKTLTLTDPATVGRYTVGFMPGAMGDMEVVLLGKSGASYVLGSSLPLYLHGYPAPGVEVTGPASVSPDCSNTGATFNFTASSPGGLASYQAFIVPALPGYPDGRLPGFSFNLANPDPQSYPLSTNELVPGTGYTLHFKVTSTEGISREAQWDFIVDSLDAESIIFNSPAANAFVRATDRLTVNTTVYLRCEKTITASTLSTNQDGTQWMPPTALSCSPVSSTKAGLAAFQCTGTFTCNQWLGRSDCADPGIASGSIVNLVADVTASGGSGPTNLQATRDVPVGSRINLSFRAEDTVFWLERGYVETSHIPFVIVSSVVLPYEVPLVLNYSSGEPEVKFTCGAGSNICRIDGPVPQTDATVTLGLQPEADSVFRVVAPAIATVKYDGWLASCDTQAHVLTCPSGQTRKMKIYKWREFKHDLLFASISKDNFRVGAIHTGSNIDILASIRRRDPGDSGERFGIQYWVRHYNSSGTWVATTKSTVYEVAANPTAQFIQIPDTVWLTQVAQRYWSYGDVEFDIDSDAGIDQIFARQCYCE